MRSAYRELLNESFKRCRETCPAVEGAFSDLLSDIKDSIAPQLLGEVEKAIEAACNTVKNNGTIKLRDAMDEVISELIASESENYELKRRVSDLERSVNELQNEVDELTEQLDAANI